MHRQFEETIHTELAGKLDYGTYLKLGQILSAQEPLSAHHDEPLFIIQHQTSELWMKLIVHELRAANVFVQNNNLPPCFKILSRVKHIQRMLFEQWAVLETLTPTEYAAFRHLLGPASGFQSYQYRMIEFLLGNKDASALRVFRHQPEIYAELEQLLKAPSLYDEFVLFLSRHGFDLPAEVTDRDWSVRRASCSGLESALLTIYNHPERNWDAYEMAEKLVDVEEQFLLWRFRHMKTVERIIGFKTGTGGSSGVPFLKAALETRLFPELWDVRTRIGVRA